MRVEKRSNSILLKGLCVLLPATTLVAAHYIPWKRFLHRELPQLGAYAVGTAAIVGTASLAIALSEGDNEDNVIMLNLAAISAGLATIAAHAVDALWQRDGKIIDLQAQIDALKNQDGNVR